MPGILDAFSHIISQSHCEMDVIVSGSCLNKRSERLNKLPKVMLERSACEIFIFV